jgi:hypothetical protein
MPHYTSAIRYEVLPRAFIEFIRPRVAVVLVVQQEVAVHSPARMRPIRISTGIVLRGHCSFYVLDQECKWQCAHGCGDMVNLMMRSLLGW